MQAKAYEWAMEIVNCWQETFAGNANKNNWSLFVKTKATIWHSLVQNTIPENKARKAIFLHVNFTKFKKEIHPNSIVGINVKRYAEQRTLVTFRQHIVIRFGP